MNNPGPLKKPPPLHDHLSKPNTEIFPVTSLSLVPFVSGRAIFDRVHAFEGNCLHNVPLLLSYFEKNSSYVSGVSVCIFLALSVWMCVAGANKVEGTMRYYARNQ